MKIFSPMATGNGAYVVHKSLADRIEGYTLAGYHPNWTLFPPALPFLFRHRKADVIHTAPDYGYFFNKNETPLVLTFHSFVIDRDTARYSTLLQRLHHRASLYHFIRKALSVATSVTSVSRFTAEMVRREFNYTGNIKVIYNGIDTDRFKPVKKGSSSVVRVLFSGNLTRRKGAHLLPAIASLLNKNIELLYTSGLRDRNALTSLPNMRNLGSIPYSQMPEIYQQADILLFPTVREGFGLAAAEAMSCGLPVVATNCSSIPELVIDKSGGFLCDIENKNQFAKAINILAESPTMRNEMGDFNRSRIAEKFNIRQMVQGYLGVFQNVHYSVNK